MFPITDPSRADDIRMRRRRAVWLLAGIAACGILAARHESARTPASLGAGTDAAANRADAILQHVPTLGRFGWNHGAAEGGDRRDSLAMGASGAALSVSLPCAGSVTVASRPTLSGRVLVSSRDGAAPDGLGLRLTSGPTITLSGGCGDGAPDVVVQAPPTMPLNLVQSGGGDMAVGAFTGAVHLRQQGSGDVAISQAGSLDGEMSGSGDLAVTRLDGRLRIVQRGGGDLSVGRIQAPEASVDAEGSGDVSIRSGTIGRLDATIRGSGDLSVEAEIGDATVQAGEGSDITLPRVRGRLERNTLKEGAATP